MITKILEGLIISSIGAAIALILGIPILSKEIEQLKIDNAAHIEWANRHVARRDAMMLADKAELIGTLNRIDNRLESLNDCIRSRSCTK